MPGRLGRCRSDFLLRMTRADIGSYLGLKIETISRTLTQFAEKGLIEVHDKHIRLVDLDGLERIWNGDGGGAGRRSQRAGAQRCHALTLAVDAHHRRLTQINGGAYTRAIVIPGS